MGLRLGLQFLKLTSGIRVAMGIGFILRDSGVEY
jgi:hypothetical protein